ncbi:uncharacterized protein RCC_09319 [Ramularia collo-cygni]|uniref:Uncharacterized protein n=1 Tax=Ramularia collo-cygni TaxID=112498 RepID=A0A2D3VCZ1_9PEZI|nr:uncharacterized protein RCC_09319 [Ramularia collo-cygni]CZT23605.1 uncharacterized protein RCC_09319 [Ramularia collo-cygni]
MSSSSISRTTKLVKVARIENDIRKLERSLYAAGATVPFPRDALQWSKHKNRKDVPSYEADLIARLVLIDDLLKSTQEHGRTSTDVHFDPHLHDTPFFRPCPSSAHGRTDDRGRSHYHPRPKERRDQDHYRRHSPGRGFTEHRPTGDSYRPSRHRSRYSRGRDGDDEGRRRARSPSRHRSRYGRGRDDDDEGGRRARSPSRHRPPRSEGYDGGGGRHRSRSPIRPHDGGRGYRARSPSKYRPQHQVGEQGDRTPSELSRTPYHVEDHGGGQSNEVRRQDVRTWPIISSKVTVISSNAMLLSVYTATSWISDL